MLPSDALLPFGALLRRACGGYLLLLVIAASPPAPAQQRVIRLEVDATEASRRLLHVQETIPAGPGPVTLLYPKWIPGEHGPTGPIADVTALRFRALRPGASPEALPWRRDSTDLYAFHLNVPAGVSQIEARFDFVSPPNEGGFSSGSSMTTELAVISWNQVVLYPLGPVADEIPVQAMLKLPRGWQFGSALPVTKQPGDGIEFRTQSLTRLIDSPVSAGAHYKTLDLGMVDGARHWMHIAADSESALSIPPEWLEQNNRLLREAGVLFGSRHYGEYHFLLTLSDHVASFGLEHHESSDNRLGERAILNLGTQHKDADLLAHEYVHSWNGKYRRPAGLLTRNYSEPMKSDLLWIYEGLTEYLGEVLAARAGLISSERFRDWLAVIAGRLEHQAGRKWRPLADTAVSAQSLFRARDDYSSYRRGIDFYSEGALVWLEVDTMIGELSRGSKSLDDFCRAFFGGESRGPDVRPYSLEDVVATLRSVQPYDWAEVFRKRVDTVQTQAPVAGIESSGWRLSYSGERSSYWREEEDQNKVADFSLSLGLIVNYEGYVTDVAMDGPAWRAGMAPAGKITSVSGHPFSTALLRDALRSDGTSRSPTEIVVKNGDYSSTHHLDYRAGEKYPRLSRVGSRPDLLTAITRPRTK